MTKKIGGLRGVESLNRKLQKYPGIVMQELQQGIAGSALLVQNDMRRSIQKGPSTGRTYKRTKDGKFHRASAPGEAPATDSGRLVSHVNFILAAEGLLASIGIHDVSNIVYAARLEFGGRDKRGIYIAPRPYIRPALDRNVKAIILRLKKAYLAGSRRIARGR